MGFFDWFPFNRRKAERTEEELAEVRRLFAARYDHFRLLILANTRCHDLIAELEEALRGLRPYGMRYVRHLCTRISTSIYQMVRHLNELDHGSYSELFDKFKEIQEQVNLHTELKMMDRSGELILPIQDVGRDHTDLCGPKMSMLGEAGHALNISVPAGFVVTSAAYSKFMAKDNMKEEIDRLLQMADVMDPESMFQVTSKVMQLIIDAQLPEELAAAILAAYDAMAAEGGDINLAVRSSALGEDIEGAAYAGQYRSVLNVNRSTILYAYKEVVASKYSLQATTYRRNRGLKDEDVAMCVGCLSMVNASSSGVAYTSNPVNFRDAHVSIYSVWGLPKAVVDGSTETDEFSVARTEPLSIDGRHVAEKKDKYICEATEGLCRMDLLEEHQNEPSLTDEQALHVAAEALRIEEHFGYPQDMEWAIGEDGVFNLLQCRPLMPLESEDRDYVAVDDLPKPVYSGGKTASPGVGSGPVHIVMKEADALTFPDGGVMVLRYARPSAAALLGKCSAVIAEQGSVAGHLANVAREFGVPALFRVEDGLSLFEDGMVLTVDADACRIYGQEVPELITEKQRKNLMRGSPVQAALRKAARNIVRLNLTDPESPDFSPSQCKTYHDIMRYCHEMAVREMFEFGTNEDFIQAASRQLICGVPKQFWILNLDDGIMPEGEDRGDSCVLLEHVDCVPMRAIWDGMQAVPWEGPPPLHAKGLLSVMFEATANPDLNPTGRSQYTQKNYFMISKNYCSLQSRFGFHFCGAEALVGERTSENYASFQFKGGAANPERRIRRAQFIGGILEEFDFRVRVREDNLVARLEGLDHPTMVHRLKVLGYLITHTRQLDMIMTDNAEVARRKARFFDDFKRFDLPVEES